MFRLSIGGALVLGLLAGGCAPQASTGTDTIGPGYVTGGGEWNTGGGVTAVARIFERDGETVVCGAWTAGRQSSETLFLNEGVMEAASVYAGPKRLVQNLSFMPRLAYSDNISGAQARCATSSVPWRAEFAEAGARLRFPLMGYPPDIDDEGGGGGNALIFREAARSDITG